MVKRVVIIMFTFIVAFSAFGVTVQAAGASPPADDSDYIIMTLDSNIMNVNSTETEVDSGRDTTPVSIDGRTMLPARALTEAMGGTVNWDDATKQVTLSVGGNTLIMTLGQKSYTINGQQKTMDAAPMVRGGRTLIPLAFAGEVLGCAVEWFEDTREILVTFRKGQQSVGTDAASIASFFYSDALDENGFWKGVKALDYVEIFKYKAFPIPKDIHYISDDNVQNEINGILANYSSEKQVTDRAVVKGDNVNIDYVGSIDGVAFTGGSTEGAGTNVTAGSTDYIDDFLTQIIGHKPGDTFNVEVTFPDNYAVDELSGKDAVFATTINYIVGNTLTDLDDEFVAENFSNLGWTTVKEMKDAIRSELQKIAAQQYIYDYFITEVTFQSIPESLTKFQEQAMLNYYQSAAESYGIKLEDFLVSASIASGIAGLIDSNYELNMNSAKFCLVVQAIAEDAGISVGDKDMADYFTKSLGTSDYSSYQEQFGLPYLKQLVLSQMVIDYVFENAVLE